MEYHPFFRSIFVRTITFVLAAISLLYSPSFAEDAPPDTIRIADISHDSTGKTPAGWENVLGKKQRAYTDYTVEYDNGGPYIRAISRSAGSWIERPLKDIDISRYPFLEWDWMVSSFPKVEWERNKDEDDFAIRVELVFDYRGNALNPLYLMRKGLITYFFRHNPPALVLSSVWGRRGPGRQGLSEPEIHTTRIIPSNRASITSAIGSASTATSRPT